MKRKLLLAAVIIGAMGSLAAWADAPTDGQTYAAIDGYNCKDLWMYETGEDEFEQFPWGSTENSARSAAIDIDAGKVYVASYGDSKIYVFDLKTGEYENAVSITGGSGSFWMSQICIDDYGNIVVGSSKLGVDYLYTYLIDLDAGTATELATLSMADPDDPGTALGSRADYFDAKGDVTGTEADGVIMWVSNATPNVFRYVRSQGSDTWEGGFDGYTYLPIEEASHSITSGWGTSCVLKMISADSEYFMVDGGSTFPNVYDMDGNMLTNLSNASGITTPTTSMNGVEQFTLNGKQFLAYAEGTSDITATVGICELPNGITSFSGMTNYWSVPSDGLYHSDTTIRMRSITAKEGTCEIDGEEIDGVFLLDYEDEVNLGVYFIYYKEASEETPEVSAPTVTTGEVTDLNGSSATLNGKVEANGTEINVAGFEYWNSYESVSESGYLDDNGNLSLYVEDLGAASTYSYRAWAIAKNDTTTYYGETLTFETPIRVNAYGATQIGFDFATLVGAVDAGSSTIEDQGFKIAEDEEGVDAAEPVTGEMTENGEFEYYLEDLEPGTPYFFKAYVIVEGDTVYSDIQYFQTLAPASVVTGEASDITTDSAVLTGQVIAGDSEITSQGFEYWSIDFEGSIEAEMDEEGNMTATLEGLDAGTSYSWRAYAVADGDTIVGETNDFDTDDIPPVVTTSQAIEITDSTATLVGQIELGSKDLDDFGFMIGTTSDIDEAVAVAADIDEEGNITASVTDLDPEATYYFWAFATTDTDTYYGDIATFDTEAAGVASIDADAAASISISGKTIIVSAQASQIGVYNVSGQMVAYAENATEVDAPVTGLYIVKAVIGGAPVVAKIIVR